MVPDTYVSASHHALSDEDTWCMPRSDVSMQPCHPSILILWRPPPRCPSPSSFLFLPGSFTMTSMVHVSTLLYRLDHNVSEGYANSLRRGRPSTELSATPSSGRPACRMRTDSAYIVLLGSQFPLAQIHPCQLARPYWHDGSSCSIGGLPRQPIGVNL